MDDRQDLGGEGCKARQVKRGVRKIEIDEPLSLPPRAGSRRSDLSCFPKKGGNGI